MREAYQVTLEPVPNSGVLVLTQHERTYPPLVPTTTFFSHYSVGFSFLAHFLFSKNFFLLRLNHLPPKDDPITFPLPPLRYRPTRSISLLRPESVVSFSFTNGILLSPLFGLKTFPAFLFRRISPFSKIFIPPWRVFIPPVSFPQQRCLFLPKSGSPFQAVVTSNDLAHPSLLPASLLRTF